MSDVMKEQQDAFDKLLQEVYTSRNEACAQALRVGFRRKCYDVKQQYDRIKELTEAIEKHHVSVKGHEPVLSMNYDVELWKVLEKKKCST